jgi:hypothetical protein
MGVEISPVFTITGAIFVALGLGSQFPSITETLRMAYLCFMDLLPYNKHLL